ncbi:GDP-mannose 4,6-dehydratase [Actinoplanes sp. TRM 88003]|uniref:GDP-mannose 4,6-dehydratase n=1 Tax=Paractinoplanes aksuensis TaxID=2939490 RepID=A0ABT1DH30_9ACTN|nr:GDP-mannose 4,6-dehydratase [Actinoplanes aksuensis]MCO8270104.1 GDP-mannose 4,6-dehydratase [Actinoplanes aksuensis]
MNVLVTGGAGFIGSHFVRAMLAGRLPGLEGARVTVLDKLTYAGNFANLGPVAHDKRLDFVPGDVADPALAEVVVRRHDTVVHFAAEADVTSTVVGTTVLLDAALRHGVARFVHISTGSVYGSIPAGAWAERAALSPTSPYAAMKGAADLLVLAAHRTHGLPVLVVRPSPAYGSHQHPENLIPRLVTAVLTGGRAALHGASARDWLHVHDLIRAVALVLADGRAGEVYNVAGSIELAHRDLAALLLEELGATWDSIDIVPAPPGEDARQALDDDKIRHDLGWRPHVEFASGLTSTVGWYRDNPGWWRPLLP